MADAREALFPGTAFISTVLESLDTKHRMTGQITPIAASDAHAPC